MKHKQQHLLLSSFAMLLFVVLGYIVKFFPEDLTSFDSQLQLALRGHLPEGLTQFFKGITVAGNVSTQAVIVAVAVLALLALSWRAEALFVLSMVFLRPF